MGLSDTTAVGGKVDEKGVKAELGRRVEAVTAPDALEHLLAEHVGPEAAGGGWTTKIVQLDGTGAATVQCSRPEGPTIFAKLYPPHIDGAAIHDKLRRLRDEGGLGAGSRHQAVEPLGYVAEYDLLFTRGAEGPAVADHVGVDDRALEAGCAEAGHFLAKLHTTPLRIGPPQSLLDSGELLSLSRRLAKTVVRRPDWNDPAQEMIRVLETLTLTTVEGRFSQSAGQFRPIHVFLGDVVTVIDLDRSRPCDPARDVAEFLHRLRTTAYSRTGSGDAAEAPSRAFLSAYAKGAGRDLLANLAFHLARFSFHSLNRKVKEGDDLENGPLVRFYRAEFDLAASGRLLDEVAGG